MITPRELLDTSIAQLRTLAAFLGEQLDESAGGDTAQSSTLEVCACKDMLVSLTVLLQGAASVAELRESRARRCDCLTPSPQAALDAAFTPRRPDSSVGRAAD